MADAISDMKVSPLRGGAGRCLVEGRHGSTRSRSCARDESPADVYAVARNASATRSAKILVTMIKEKGAPATVPVK
jgi:hypothetical protein